jgi:hypothetical protein
MVGTVLFAPFIHNSSRGGAVKRKQLAVVGLAALAVVATSAMSPASALRDPEHNLSQVVSQTPVGCTPQVIGDWDDPSQRYTQVLALANLGGMIYAGGKFDTVWSADGSTSYPRQNFFAFSVDTAGNCTLSPLTMNFDDEVEAIWPSPDGTALFIGGKFTHVNGQSHPYLIKYDLATQSIDEGFNAGLDGMVWSMLTVHGRLIIGGQFQHVGGVLQADLAAVSMSTGARLSYINSKFEGVLAPNSGPPEVFQIAARPDGSQIAVIGNYLTIDGQRRGQMSLLNIGKHGDHLANWDGTMLRMACKKNYPQWSHDIAYSPDGTRIALATTGAGPPHPRQQRLCDDLSTWDTTTHGLDQDPQWIVTTPRDTMWSVAWTSAAIYVAGHFRGVRGVGGSYFHYGGLAAVTSKGHIIHWYPQHELQLGSQEMLVIGDGDTSGLMHGLIVGSDSGCGGDGVHHPYPHQGICYLPAS